MLIISRVCAVFKDRHGKEIHRITPALRGITHEAPEAIQEDRLFKMLLKDGSLSANLTPVQLKAVENDPYFASAKDGKSVLAKKEPADEPDAKEAKIAKSAAKAAKAPKETEADPKAEAVPAADTPAPDKAD